MIPYIYPFGFPLFCDLQRPGMSGWVNHHYTARVQELIQEKHPDLDLLQNENLISAAKDVIFMEQDLALLDPKYRDAFVLGFVTEYWMAEIGQETTDLWKMAIKSVLVSKHNRINHLYALSEKELGTEYTHRSYGSKVGSTGSRSSSRLFGEERNGTNSLVNDGTTTGKQNQSTSTEGNNTQTRDLTNTGTNNSTITGEDTRTEKFKNRFSDTPQNGLEDVENDKYLTNVTINDTTENGTNSNTTSGSENRTDKGTVTDASTGSSTLNGTTEGTSKSTMSGTNKDTINHNENVSEDSAGNTNTDGSEDSYTLNYDLVMKQTDAIEEVWSLFDDCFMGVM